MCFLQPTRVHNPNGNGNRSVQPFLHISQQKVPILCNGCPFPQIVPSHGRSGPHLTYESLGQSKPTTQTASLLVQLFCTDDHSVPILYNGSSLPPLKTAPSHEGMLTPSNTWFLGSIPVLNQNISVSQLPFLQG